jgi:hypothetical protein
MNWFYDLTGFDEEGYEETKAKLRLDGETLSSLVNGRSFGAGNLEVTSLRELRNALSSARGWEGTLEGAVMFGDVRELHRDPALKGALFQVASQFNLLEMAAPSVTPEDGVGRYEYDPTQGPACAIAAGAATIYRNYFVPVGAASGQTSARQIDTINDLGTALADRLDWNGDALWTMTNGYALCTRDGLRAIGDYLRAAPAEELERLRGLLRIGVHRDVQATESGDREQIVSQAFCSALPVAYVQPAVDLVDWEPFASLILEATYEATFCAAVLNARRGASNILLLTRVGGGAFGNADHWIDKAVQRSLRLFAGYDLDVRHVRRLW